MTTTKANSVARIIGLSGALIFTLVITTACILLLFEPVNLNIDLLMRTIIGALFIGALLLSYPIASKDAGKLLTTIGTLVIAILLTFIGLFIIAGVGWLVALSHAQY